MFKIARHWSLFWARLIQSIPHAISVRSILIFFFHLRLGLQSDSFLQHFLSKFCMHFISLPCLLHASHSSFDHLTQLVQRLATGWTAEMSEFESRMDKIFLLFTSSRPVLGPIWPPTQQLPGAVSPWVKRRGRDADHSPPTSAEIKNSWISTSDSPYVFMA
jgi:hypothetical protein